MITIALREPVEIDRGYIVSGPGVVVGVSHEQFPHYDVEMADGKLANNVPAEYVAKVAA